MNALSVAAQTVAHDSVMVYWRHGEKPWQRIEVELSQTLCDPAAAAELAVLHHLLLVREIAGQNRGSAGLQLCCTRGAVRKLFRGKSNKKDLIPYAAFLRARFPDASLRVIRPPAIEEASAEPHARITLDGPLTWLTPSRMAPVQITRHALERFMQRAQCSSLDHARKAVEKMLQSQALHRCETPSRKRVAQLLRHRKDSELWAYHNWRLRIVDQGPHKALVTVYPDTGKKRASA